VLEVPVGVRVRASVEYEGETLTGSRMADGTFLVDPWIPLWGGMELSPEDYGNRIILPPGTASRDPRKAKDLSNGFRSSKLSRRNPKI